MFTAKTGQIQMMSNQIKRRITRLRMTPMMRISRTTKLTYVLLFQFLQKNQQIQHRQVEQNKWRQRRLRHRIRALPPLLLTKSVHTRLYLSSAK
ncbi:unnamed protein product [Oikopleura dioica]|uniref:Uncharacterized protein n=1 Tax=Oikopleura dioica TaxID=34765 RepID=E4Y851_OIKDI|nr:unnamed protein product [Oikopleura dioica]